MGTANEQLIRKMILQYYKKNRKKTKLSERVPNVAVIFGEFLARAGHKRFFLYDCRSFVNIKRNAGYFWISFSVYNESSGEIDEIIARWELWAGGLEELKVHKIVEPKKIELKGIPYEELEILEKTHKKIEQHFEEVFRDFIDFFKKENCLLKN